MIRDNLPALGAGGGVAAALWGFLDFGVANLDLALAALGPIAFRIAPRLQQLDAQTWKTIYLVFAAASALVAVVTLARRAVNRFENE